jgi:hypothetical protein
LAVLRPLKIKDQKIAACGSSYKVHQPTALTIFSHSGFYISPALNLQMIRIDLE